MRKYGASEGIRTLDIHLGKVTLYQTELRSLPNKPGKIKPTRLNCKPRFPAMNPVHDSLGFMQKQLPDRKRILNKTTLTLTLPSDGRGSSQTRLSQLPKRLDTPTN